jgi:hypothetical protein
MGTESQPVSPARIVVAFGGEHIGLAICQRCGATLLLDGGPGMRWIDAVGIHDRWHEEHG